MVITEKLCTRADEKAAGPPADPVREASAPMGGLNLAAAKPHEWHLDGAGDNYCRKNVRNILCTVSLLIIVWSHGCQMFYLV